MILLVLSCRGQVAPGLIENRERTRVSKNCFHFGGLALDFCAASSVTIPSSSPCRVQACQWQAFRTHPAPPQVLWKRVVSALYCATLDVIDPMTSDALSKASLRSVIPWRRAMASNSL